MSLFNHKRRVREPDALADKLEHLADELRDTAAEVRAARGVAMTNVAEHREEQHDRESP